MNFKPDFIYQFSGSSEPFPVELAKICGSLGFLDKYEALEVVERYFSEDVDYEIRESVGFLTVDCLRELTMIAPTPQGKAARRYYLEGDRIVSPVTRTVVLPQEPAPPEIIPVILPTEAQLHAMRTRESEKLELASLPALEKKIPKFRRAVDIARERALRAKEEEQVIDW